MTFGLAALPLTMMAGFGVDIANATRLRLSLQDATDSAALSLAREGPTIADSAIASTVQSYLRSGFTKAQVSVTNATLDRGTITATVDAQATSPTYFAQLMGISSLPVTAHSVAKGMLLEITMVLDTSGSMADSAGSGGPKIDALKDAAKALLDTMFGTQMTSQRVSMAIVPFSAAVNVGTSFNQSWIDTGGKSSIAHENYDKASTNSWSLFGKLKSTAWAGCMISRPPPYDVTDDAPSQSKPDTLFDPWFYPDEPDTNLGWGQSAYPNNYIFDGGGSCKTGVSGLADAALEARSCKYSGATPSFGKGPNYLCDSTAITPLTNSRTALDSAVAALQAKGNTNIFEGVMWGWRVVSPGAPFTQAKSYTAPNNRKAIILMTDGQNNLGGLNNFNMSNYSAEGFASKARLGQATSNNATLTSLLDAKTQTACSNIKAQGVVIYTIAFGADAQASQTLLRNCASDPKDFYAPQNSSDLKPVFLKIAQSINSLRIAE